MAEFQTVCTHIHLDTFNEKDTKGLLQKTTIVNKHNAL